MIKIKKIKVCEGYTGVDHLLRWVDLEASARPVHGYANVSEAFRAAAQKLREAAETLGESRLLNAKIEITWREYKGAGRWGETQTRRMHIWDT